MPQRADPSGKLYTLGQSNATYLNTRHKTATSKKNCEVYKLQIGLCQNRGTRNNQKKLKEAQPLENAPSWHRRAPGPAWTSGRRPPWPLSQVGRGSQNKGTGCQRENKRRPVHFGIPDLRHAHVGRNGMRDVFRCSVQIGVLGSQKESRQACFFSGGRGIWLIPQILPLCHQGFCHVRAVCLGGCDDKGTCTSFNPSGVDSKQTRIDSPEMAASASRES